MRVGPVVQTEAGTVGTGKAVLVAALPLYTPAVAVCSDLRCYFCSGPDGYDAVVDFGPDGSVLVFSCLDCARLAGALIEL